MRPGPEALAAAEPVLRAGTSPDAGVALTGDKSLMFLDASDAFVVFGISGGSWIAYGGPVGPAQAAEDVAFDFVEEARRAGTRPVFYEVGAEDVPVMLDLGMQLHKMGKDAVVDLSRFSLEGSSRKKLRAAHARAGRDGLTLEILSPPHDPALIERLREISDAWLVAKHAREKGFSVGRFDPAWLGRWPLAVVLRESEPVAFANVMTAGDGRAASIGLMRHADDAPSGTMKYLFTELMLQLKACGCLRFSLGMAPLSGLAPERSSRLSDRFGAAIYRHGGGFYNFEGLRAFKQKFDPV